LLVGMQAQATGGATFAFGVCNKIFQRPLCIGRATAAKRAGALGHQLVSFFLSFCLLLLHMLLAAVALVPVAPPARFAADAQRA
jgi:hypothetical protein